MNGTRCAQCPPGTVIEAGSAGGVEACMPCGEGLVTSDNVRCFSPCKLSTNDGKTYDFTPLARYTCTLRRILILSACVLNLGCERTKR